MVGGLGPWSRLLLASHYTSRCFIVVIVIESVGWRAFVAVVPCAWISLCAADPSRAYHQFLPFFSSSSIEVRVRAEFKHIIKRRKRN